MNTDSEFLITWQQLWDWSQKFSNNQIIGTRNDAFSCPCAKCIKELTGKNYMVLHNFIRLTGNFDEGLEIPMPKWMEELVRLIDGGSSGARITAGKFRKLMLQVKPDVINQSTDVSLRE